MVGFIMSLSVNFELYLIRTLFSRGRYRGRHCLFNYVLFIVTHLESVRIFMVSSFFFTLLPAWPLLLPIAKLQLLSISLNPCLFHHNRLLVCIHKGRRLSECLFFDYWLRFVFTLRSYLFV